jgi:hypothetical protein
MENFRSSCGGGFEKEMKIYCDVGCEREKIGIRNLGEVRNAGEVMRGDEMERVYIGWLKVRWRNLANACASLST